MGWTNFNQYLTTNTKIFYVSNSGSDTTGVQYSIADVGNNPSQPSISVQPYKTFGYIWSNLINNNEKCWILFNRNETFSFSDAGIFSWGVRVFKESTEEDGPVAYLIGAYGTESNSRPVIKNNTLVESIRQFGNIQNQPKNIAFVSLEFTLDNSNTQNNISSGMEFSLNGIRNVMFEDCFFKTGGNLLSYTIYGTTTTLPVKDITFNRCVFSGSYKNSGHNQGLFLSGGENIVIQECVFDNNGYLENPNNPSTWTGQIYVDNTSSNTFESSTYATQPRRTWFSRNLYLSSYTNLSVVGNILTRSGSAHQLRVGGLFERNVVLCNTEGVAATPTAGYSTLTNALYNKNLVMLADPWNMNGSNNQLAGISAGNYTVTIEDNICKDFYRTSNSIAATGYRKYSGFSPLTLDYAVIKDNVIHLKSGSSLTSLVGVLIETGENVESPKVSFLSGSGNYMIAEDSNKTYVSTGINSIPTPPPSWYGITWNNNYYYNAANNKFGTSTTTYATWQSNGFDTTSTNYTTLNDMATALNFATVWDRDIVSYMEEIDPIYVPSTEATVDDLVYPISNKRANAPKIKDMLQWGYFSVSGGTNYVVNDTFIITREGSNILRVTVTEVDATTGAILKTKLSVLDPLYLTKSVTNVVISDESVSGTGATKSHTEKWSQAIAEDWATKYHAFSSFLLRAKENRIGNWDSNFTADALNSYIREGYGKSSVGGSYSSGTSTGSPPPPPSPPSGSEGEGEESGNPISSPLTGTSNDQVRFDVIRIPNQIQPVLSLDIDGEFNYSDRLSLRKNKTNMIGTGLQDFIISYRNTILNNSQTKYIIPEDFQTNWSYKTGSIARPTLLAPCFLWIKPEGFGTSNNTVSQIADFSNQGDSDNSYTSTDTLTGGSTVLQNKNGYYPIKFNGTSDGFFNDGETLDFEIGSSTNFAFSFVIYLESINSSTNNCIFSVNSNNSNGYLAIFLNQSGNSNALQIVTRAGGVNSTVSTKPDALTDGENYIVTVSRINGTPSIKLNGQEQEIDGTTINPVVSTSGGSYIGVESSTSGVFSNYYKHSLYEFILAKSTNNITLLSDSVEKIEGYLSAKYLISLPVNHPYKDKPHRVIVELPSVEVSLPVCNTLSAIAGSTTFSESGGTESVTVTVTSENCTWAVSTEETWISFSATNGTGNGSFSFTISENQVTSQRTGYITVVSGSAPSVNIEITQAAAVASSGWTPSSIASTSHWYDASLETGANGSNITVSTDQSGSTNLTAVSGVTLLTNWSNGLPGYNFNSADQNTLAASSVTTLSGAIDAWVFVVHDVQNSASNPFLWYYSDIGSSTAHFAIQPRFTGNMWFRVQGSLVGNTSAGSSASGNTITGMRTNGATLHAYQNGTELTLTNPTITSSFPSQTAALMAIGNDNSGNKLGGVVGEVIFGNGTLSDSDRQKIEGYLAHKWGLTANLPADHPYKNSEP